MNSHALDLTIGEDVLYYRTQFAALESDKSARFHWPAALLTTCWLAYRRMYLYACLSFFATSLVHVLTILIGSQLDPVFGVGFLLGAAALRIGLMGRFGNRIYHAHACRKMQEVNEASSEAPLYYYAAVGGVSGFAAAVALAAEWLSNHPQFAMDLLHFLVEYAVR